MKKFTLTIVAALVAVVAFGQESRKESALQPSLDGKIVAETVEKKLDKKSSASQRAASTVDDLVGDYYWTYQTSSTIAADPSTIEPTDKSCFVTITATGNEDELLLSGGLFEQPVTGTVNWEYGVVIIPRDQVAYIDEEDGACNLYDLFYDTESTSWKTYTGIYAYIQRDGSLAFDDTQWLCYIFTEGDWAGYLMTPYTLPGSVMTKLDPTEYNIEHGQVTFENGTMDSFTTIDADDDGNTWYRLGMAGHYSGAGVTSASYAGGSVLTPDNYLVSPKVALGGKITFYAAAQDQAWPGEVFNVAVSTTGNTSAADFTNIWEADKTMTAGGWFKYEADLSKYAGQEGYVAIRHYNCTDMFRLNVDDITITDATGIKIVKMGKDGKAIWYNLNGTRVDKPTKGVFIQDGKKVVVK
ncbi:MAG: choice-of-anchor J domain-containing protein [Prevotella sp.]|nr:choice-of-anchor J domain-containing protein [Prevotella sp.]